MIRIGQSTDIHRLKKGRKLILGGVEIPCEFGLDGHSDADVLIHAVAESLLGALALGDLGSHFPDTDPTYKNIDSRKLLQHVINLVENKGFHLVNLDALILAQKPKLAPYISQMRDNLAHDLHCSIDQVSVKATTAEKLGFIGHEEGMAAQCVCLVEK